MCEKRIQSSLWNFGSVVVANVVAEAVVDVKFSKTSSYKVTLKQCDDANGWTHLNGCWTKIPARLAVIKHEIQPAINARNAIFESNGFLFGTIPPKTPSWMPMEEKFENPQRAYVAIICARA